VWGGGTLTAAGTASLLGDAPVDQQLQARDVSLRYPRDFKSRIHADVTLSGRIGQLLLSGQVRAERGLYDTDIDLVREAFRDAPEAAPPPPAWLSTVALDLELVTERAVQIRNNLARLSASGRLSLRGDLQAPAPFGRLSVREGGRIFLQTREFVVESGTLTFAGTLDPEITMSAPTRRTPRRSSPA
jgi:autotransporter translocation and assembly factor TamB